MGKDYPTKIERRKKNLTMRNRRLARDMKATVGIMRHFQTRLPKKVANGRR